jgi:hypothetical protein
MSNISWRHHYIPEFYLKGFVNENGTFKIFDVERQEFVKDGKDFTPKTHFFEIDGNTIYTENGPDDFIETKFYSRSDNRIAEIFNRINDATPETRFGLSEEDMPALQHFVSILFWRLPTNYDQIKYLLRTKELHELGLLLKSKETNEIVKDEEFENKVRNDPNFFKALKHYLPYITYPRLLDCRTPLTIQTFPEQLPALCSDNPVIFMESNLPDIYYDDLILPLTHTHVFIRGNKIREDVLTTIKIDIDLIVLKQAKKYVSCTDTKYIELLNKYYSSNFDSLTELKRKVFDTLIEK